MSLPVQLPAHATLGQIRQWLIDYAAAQLERVQSRYAPHWQLPAMLAGHPVGPDVRGDLVFDLGMLHELGVRSLGGVPLEMGIRKVLAPLDGPGTHSFYSYRVAETLLRFGRFDRQGNPLLAGLDAAACDNLAAACDSTAMIDQLGSTLPRNYVAVLARCELARERLGLAAPSAHLAALVDGTHALLASNPLGFIDDSNDGSSRFDIYLADVYLFTEPLADRLGDLWRRGLAAAGDLVLQTMTRDGTSIPWGRSTGALGVVLSVELAALNLGRGLANADVPRWGDALLRACRSLPGWFGDGLIAAHQHRSTYGYRGPHRRLQMTFDVLGKLLQSAIELGRLDAAGLARAVSVGPQTPRDVLIPLSSAGARVWSYASRDARLVLPLVGGVNADYLPAPRNPGMFEVPVDSQLATGVPVVMFGASRWVPAGPPATVDKRADGLRAGWRTAVELRRGFGERGGERTLDRRVDYRIDGATLHVGEQLDFAAGDLPDGITVQVTERRERPLKVRFESGRACIVDVDGLKEYRSFWGELSRVHQVDLDPAAEVRIDYSITPKLRVMTNARDHHYHRSLYDPIAEDVHELQFPWRSRHELGDLAALFEHVDQFHLHWPEHFLYGHLEASRRLIEALRSSDVRIVWTQHNLVPHRPEQRVGAEALYQLWADAADAIIHHSESGRRRIHERYVFRDDVIERVIGHGHFGNLMQASAFAACQRDDLQLFVTCLSGAESVPDDARIHACEYQLVARELYDARLAAIDVLVMPIEPGELLTTGVIGDAIGGGIAAICSRWDFLSESLGDAAIYYDGTTADLTRVFEQLDAERVARSAAAMAGLRPRYDWGSIAAQHLQLLRAVGTLKL